MLRDERLDKMNDFVHLQKYVTIDELMEEFQISRATVRRDLDILSDRGLVTLTRGGARGNTIPELEAPYQKKLEANPQEKARIGAKATEMILDNQAVFIDTGTTTREMVPYLLQRKNIHIVTNDIHIATQLTHNVDIDITVTGGKVRKGYYTLRGHTTEAFLKQLHVDMAFVSLDAIDYKFGCSVTNMDEVLIKQMMVSASCKTIALCDHSKFETFANWKVCELADIDLYITGKEISKDILTKYEANSIQFKIV